MKKSKILFLIIPLLVFITLVGVGFSSWYFGHDELKVTNTNNISVYVASDVTKGEISLIESPSNIVFSQGNGEVNNAKDGINFYKEENNVAIESDKVVVKYTLKDPNDSIEGSSFKLFITINGTNFSNVIKLTNIYSQAAEDALGYDFKDDLKVITTTSDDEPYGYFLYTLNLSNVIEYKSAGTNGVKPIDQDKYTALKENIKDGSITIRLEVM